MTKKLYKIDISQQSLN